MNKPAIVIVPGAWHMPSHYVLLRDSLKSAGYEVTTCRMPSVGPPEPLPDMYPDIKVVQEAVKSYINRDLNVVLAMHSLGGLIGSSACKDLLPADQKTGKGVISLAYITAFAMHEGPSMMESRPDHERQHGPWVYTTGPMGTNVFMCPGKPPYDVKEVFYNDCTPEQQEAALKDLKINYSENVVWTPIPYTAWKNIESNYLICEIDNAIDVKVQEYMSSQEGGKWKRVERLHSGHSPFLNYPDETAAFVRRCAGEDL